jgi:hypothetical protein
METSRVKFVVQNEACYSNFADQERGRYYRGKESSVAYGAVAGRKKVVVVYSLAFLLFKLQGSYVKNFYNPSKYFILSKNLELQLASTIRREPFKTVGLSLRNAAYSSHRDGPRVMNVHGRYMQALPAHPVVRHNLSLQYTEAVSWLTRYRVRRVNQS